MVYWTEADDPIAALPGAATTLEGFPSRAELVAAYQDAGGRPVGDLDYYVAFGYWKLACILEGVYTRYKAGAMGNDGADAEVFGDTVRLLGRVARRARSHGRLKACCTSSTTARRSTEPVMVMVLEGWIDAGYAAATAAQTLLGGLDSYPVATFDTDSLLDHRARRPIMHLVDGVNTGLSWPSLELRAGVDGEGRDVLLLLGAEPDHSWRAFTEAALELAQAFGTRMLVGLGAYPATVPHTRPVSLSVTAANPDLAATSGLLRGTLDVPAGVQAVLDAAAARLGIPPSGCGRRSPTTWAETRCPTTPARSPSSASWRRSAGSRCRWARCPATPRPPPAPRCRGRQQRRAPRHAAGARGAPRRDGRLGRPARRRRRGPQRGRAAAEVEQFLRARPTDRPHRRAGLARRASGAAGGRRARSDRLFFRTG
ncbi:MAG: PAC2 family protein [Acidimicrobiales bacterium]